LAQELRDISGTGGEKKGGQTIFIRKPANVYPFAKRRRKERKKNRRRKKKKQAIMHWQKKTSGGKDFLHQGKGKEGGDPK